MAMECGAQQSPPAGQPTTAEKLPLQQSQIADKYTRLEQLMIRMAEIEAISNPQRAALLKQAVQQSTARLTRGQLNTVAELLKPPAQLNRAIEQQQQALNDLNDLLKLLLSENRSDRLKAEQERIREYLKELERIRRLQQGLQGRTEGGVEAERLAGEQDRVAGRANDLAESIQKDEPGDSSADSSDAEGAQAAGDEGRDPEEREPEDSQGTEPQEESDDSEPRQEGSPDGEQPSGQGTPNGAQSEQPGSEQPPAGGQSGDGQTPQQSESSGQGGPQSQTPPQSRTPQQEARDGIQAAEQRMRAAQQRLDEAKRRDAIAEQEQALKELEKAKAALEKILRQLREEEVERMLALLESRFRRMLAAQLKINESTRQIDSVTAEQRGREVDIRASKLSFEQSKLATEAQKALNLLREEGSSIAFPETVEQMRDEMIHVSDRLAAVQVGVVTQAAQEDIVAALEEMIAALQKAQKDLEKQQQQQQQMQTPPDPGDRPLVDQLAELKMIRSLQMRVNKRTQRFAQLLTIADDPVGEFQDQDLRNQLERLSKVQLRVYRITRDIVLGKNE